MGRSADESSYDDQSTFFKVSLALSLSGISCLGYVLPNVLKHQPQKFMCSFSFMTGAIVNTVISIMPVHIVDSGMLSTAQFCYLQSLVFIIMLLFDVLDERTNGSYWGKMAESLIRDEISRYGFIDNEYDIELSRRYNRRMSGGHFSRVETNEDNEVDFEDEVNDSLDNDNNHSQVNDSDVGDGVAEDNTLKTTTEERFSTNVLMRPIFVGARVKALTSILLLAIGTSWGISEGLFIAYKDDMTAVDVEMILSRSLLLALVMSFYLIVSGGNSIFTITCLVLLYAVAPLIGTSLALPIITRQSPIVHFNSQVHATLCTLLSGAFLYLSLLFMTPVAVAPCHQDSNSEGRRNLSSFSPPASKMMCVICFSAGFIVSGTYGATLALR